MEHLSMAENASPKDALLSHMLRFAPVAKMFYSGTLCGLSPDVDGTSDGSIHLLSRGELSLTRQREAPLLVQAPCVVLMPRPLEHRVEGLGAAGVDLMCATLSDLAPPLSMVIPDITVVDLRTTARLRRPVELMFEEADDRAYGYGAAVDRLLQYTLVVVIRHLVENDMLQGGVLDAMADDRLSAVLEALHAAPGRQWTLDSMATLSNLSRSAFAQRFAQVVGVPPLLYLTGWRMSLARSLLAEGKPVKVVATQTGYRSVAAFARAFQRTAGVPPGAWQRTRLGIS
ncbi:MAG: AraC family transcriptional regulator [Burkholderiaceae bacterium]|jgi:AraC-like DNA-binding protein|nr:MAG: AraC family transcriptional regulator [Burkholderiaceae bacterium]